MGKLIETIPTEVTEAVAESLRLFRQAHFRQPGNRHGASQPLPSLLERCEQYIAAERQPRKEPIRLIHHFACTGGTLITKCLACSPNVHVLSEVDPLSKMTASRGKFAPSDIIHLARYSNRPPTQEEKISLFLASLISLYESNSSKGQRLLIRDHAHSQFCFGPEIPERPTLSSILEVHFPLRSVLTVRHPLDSWLSLQKNKWHLHFMPSTIEEYAQRYNSFLSSCKGIPTFKYEEFTQNTTESLGAMCEQLNLPMPPDFETLFMAHSFSGDSGRQGSSIEPRQRREVPEQVLQEAHESLAFRNLCKKLDYELD